jgi:hypothetical protein
MGEGDPRFRVLSLDGGGSWALIQVRTLSRLYGAGASGHDVLRRFDLAISNSGGSIVLAALAADLRLAEILKLFLDRNARESIFKSLTLAALDRDVGFGPRYRAEAKLTGLRGALKASGDQRMREWSLTNDYGRSVRLVICAFDYDLLREVFFRTQPEPAGTAEGRLPKQQAIIDATFAQAVHASSNAPVNYFDAPATWGDGCARFWDGAMGGFNNPVLAGVVEAVRSARVSPSAIRALSLGTGSVVLPEAGSSAEEGLVLPRRALGLATYAKTAATCILDDPPDNASYVAHVMLGGGLPSRAGDVVTEGPVIRMSPVVQPVRGTAWKWEVPSGLDGDQFRRLVSMDMDATSDDEVARISGLADLWLDESPTEKTVRNQPIRASRWLEVEIGHATFEEARRAWQRNGDGSVSTS